MASAAERVAVLLLLGLASCDCWPVRRRSRPAAPEPWSAADGLVLFIEYARAEGMILLPA
ncbi:MAG: hypothetical protein IPK74_32180 [Deltaproteobacteria bacterium]|nr:hypothetical protein [Deltaproteobacteria bacterium]